MTFSYRIQDEPQPSLWSHFAVNPLWPLLSMMLAGVWLAWPWFIFNGFIIGSPTRWRELIWIISGLVGNIILSVVVIMLINHFVQSPTAMQYILLILLVWKLAVSYMVFMLQTETFELYEYYGGVVKNGIWVLLIGTFLGRRFLYEILNPFVWLWIN
jgi:hypothetical protein